MIRRGERLTDVLLREGANGLDAALADQLATQARELPAGTRVSVELVRAGADKPYDILRLIVTPTLGTTITISRNGDRLAAITRIAQVDSRPLRLGGLVGGDLRASLRAAGATMAEAEAFVRALRQRIATSDLKPLDRFDLMIAMRSTSAGEIESGPLLYVGLERAGGGYLQLLPMATDGRVRWVDATGGHADQDEPTMMQPINARITSGFGVRVHPILRFLRLHRGVDYAAPAGSPVVAAASGVVVRAGWSGGYGNQVRLAHPDGSETSYSHLSAITVRSGQSLRIGEQVGQVGSSGLATGPHLHFELHRHGVAVDPLGIRIAARPIQAPVTAEVARRRMRGLLSTPFRERRRDS